MTSLSNATSKTQYRRSTTNWNGIRRGIVPAISALIVITMIFVAIFAPWIAPFDPLAQDLQKRLLEPSLFSSAQHEHYLGTNPLGQDILSILIYGARVSLLIAFITVAIRIVLGVGMGVLAGFYGGIVDDILMRLADIQIALPTLIVAIAIMAVLGPGILNLILVLALTGWVYFARVVRSEVLSLRERDFILAARSIGASNARVIRKHLLPNTISAVLVMSTLQVATVIIAESSLSFLGVGVGVRTPTWGQTISQGREYVGSAWWLSVTPGVAIFITVLAINLIGDWLRDHFDPRLRRSM